MATIYDIDYNLFIRRLLPSFLRKPITLDWLTVLVSPIVFLYNDFINFRVDILRQLSYTSQTVVFEKLLNDNADNTSRRIYIENVILIVEAAFYYQLQETTPIIDDEFSYMLSEGDQASDYFIETLSETLAQVDFIVHVPTDLTDKENFLINLIDRYKLAGKRYKIEYF